MTDRSAKIRFDAEEGPWRSVPTGIPQGSPASPILFNLYISRLLKELDEVAATGDMKVYFPTFIDDVTIVLESATWREGREDGKKLVECMYKWAEGKGMGFEDEKFQWTRIGKKTGSNRQQWRLPSGVTREEAREVKVLGVWVDAEMKWKKQVEAKTAKGRRMANLI